MNAVAGGGAPAASRWRRIALVLGVIVFACALQGVRPLYSPDEGRYTNVALAMLDDGDFVRPMLHHEVEHWSKPPLTYWAIAVSVQVFGRNAFAARLPSALAFAGTILLLLRLGRRFVPERPWLAAAVYATFVMPSVGANLVTTDSLLALWECLVVVGFADAWAGADSTERRRGRRLVAIAAGLAFMTKGPPGLLSLAACAVFAIWDGGWRGLARAFDRASLPLFAAVGLSWYVLVAIQEPGVLRYFLVEEVINRVATDKMHRNAAWYGAAKIYLPTLVLGSLPWLPFAAVALARRRDAARLAEPQTRLLLCWLLLPLAVFALARSRLPLYLLPLFAPLALLAARALRGIAVTPLHAAMFGLWAIALIAARAVPAWFDVDNDDARLAAGVRAVLTSPPAEIAFVETAPRFGLRFYLGSEIERLTTADTESRSDAQDIGDELREHEGCRLLMTDADSTAHLTQVLETLKVRYRRLADVRGYSLFAQLSGDCAWRAAH